MSFAKKLLGNRCRKGFNWEQAERITLPGSKSLDNSATLPTPPASSPSVECEADAFGAVYDGSFETEKDLTAKVESKSEVEKKVEESTDSGHVKQASTGSMLLNLIGKAF